MGEQQPTEVGGGRQVERISTGSSVAQTLESLLWIQQRIDRLAQAEPTQVRDLQLSIEHGMRTALLKQLREALAAPDDPMPVFTLLAKDMLALDTVEAYRELCSSARLHDQADEVRKAWREMFEWRRRHPDAVKMPDHPHVPAVKPPQVAT